jgi:hypothetical protein
MFPKFYRIFNYSTLLVLLIFLFLIITESVAKSAYIPLLIIALVIFIARIVLRVYLHSYLKQKSKGE